MEFPKDNCAFCYNTTQNAPKVTKDYLTSLSERSKEGFLLFNLDIDKVLSENYDALIPLYDRHLALTTYYGVRKGKMCGILDNDGQVIVPLSYQLFIPPYCCDDLLFVAKDSNNKWGVLDLEDPYHPEILVPFGTYKYMWGYDSNHCLVSAMGIGKPGTFEGRGIIDRRGNVVVPFTEFKDIWNFYKSKSCTFKVETFDGNILYFYKNNPTKESIRSNTEDCCEDDFSDDYGNHFGKYAGSYAQDVEGYSDDVIDDAFDGDPEAYWNID